MKKIILTERQLDQLSKKLLSEAVGVPKGIMEAGEKLYYRVLDLLKSINYESEDYEFELTNENSLRISKYLNRYSVPSLWCNKLNLSIK